MASNGTTDMESIAIEENSPLIKNNNNTPTNNNNNNNGNIGNNILEKNKVSFHGTFLNLLKSSLGAGLLGFPFGFRKAGWLGGIISCLILSCITGFGMHCLIITRQNISSVVKKSKKYSQREYLEFIDIAFLASGTWARRAAWWGVVVGQLGVCVSYAIFITNNLHSSVFPAETFSRVVVVLFIFPILLVLSFVKTLKNLLPVAAAGLGLLFIGIIFIFSFGLSKSNRPAFPQKLPSLDANGLVIMCGISTFAMESITQIPSLQANMKQPKYFPTVLNLTIGTMLILYALFGLFGSLMFGKKTESVITRNIPHTVTAGIGSRIALVLYILCTYPFQMYPLAQTIDRTILGWMAPSSSSEKKKDDDDDDPMRMNASSTNQTLSTMQYYSIRIVLVTTTVIVAIFAKDFGSFISLIGWSCTGTLGLVLPGYMMIKFNNGNDLSRFLYIACWLLFVSGIIMTISGTIGSILEIIHGE